MLVTWRYKDRKSFIQSFDPRAWFIFYACYLVGTVMFWDIRYQAFFFVIALLVLITSKVKWSEMRRAFLFIGVFIIFFSLLTFLTGRGGVELYNTEHILAEWRASWSILGWHPALVISAEKTMYALTMLLRVFSLAVMTILIPYSLDPSLYGVTFRGLNLPDKFAYGLDLTMRFIPTFGRDFSLTRDAQRARGYEIEKLSGGLGEQIRKLAPLLVPVTIRAILGSEDIIDAMDLRAFGIGPRTWIDKLHYSRRDKIWIGLSVAMMLICIALSLLSFGKFWMPAFLI
jgi:energy-coupling factor transport system permease protein